MIRYYSELTERRKYNEKTKITGVFKWGQMKLFLSEVSFLTKMRNESKNTFLILYIGAADGYHINKLAELFPFYMFHLWDPRDFEVNETPNIKIFQKFFTNEEAEKYIKDNKKTLIICDIRSLPIEYAKRESNFNKKIELMDEIVMEDLEFQKQWTQRIKPYAALLKFRTLYGSGKTKYFDGIIYLQQFSFNSAETRLLCKNFDEMKEYNNSEYDEKMSYFNNFIRNKPVDKWSKTLNKMSLINNLDTTMLLQIMNEYLLAVNKNNDEVSLINIVNDIINFLSKKNSKYFKQIHI